MTARSADLVALITEVEASTEGSARQLDKLREALDLALFELDSAPGMRSPAELLDRYEGWKVARAKVGVLEERDLVPPSAWHPLDEEAIELLDLVAPVLGALVGRPMADAKELQHLGLLAALPRRVRVAWQALTAYGMVLPLTDDDADQPGPDWMPVGWPWSDEFVGRYMLIQRNIAGSTPPYWVTFHDSQAAARDYEASEEYAQDWAQEELYDLDGPVGPRAL